VPACFELPALEKAVAIDPAAESMEVGFWYAPRRDTVCDFDRQTFHADFKEKHCGYGRFLRAQASDPRHAARPWLVGIGGESTPAAVDAAVQILVRKGFTFPGTVNQQIRCQFRTDAVARWERRFARCVGLSVIWNPATDLLAFD